ncbi:MAG: response regulator [Deltaproteobacteria bacterium]
MSEGQRKKILIVDDEEAIRLLCAEFLSGVSFAVQTAVNGLDAMDKLAASSFDAVILDINMPGLDGIDFYNRAIRKYEHLRDNFLFITGDLFGEIETLSLFASKEKNVLRKPFTKLQLIDALKLIVR